MKFVQWPEVNRVNCQPIIKVESLLNSFRETLQLVSDFVADEKNNCVGIAAPQINNAFNWFIAKNIIQGESTPILIINPLLLDQMGSSKKTEGCFSVPNQHYRVSRPKEITCSFVYIKNLDISTLQVFKGVLEGRAAQIWMHEYHHICNKTIVDIGQPIE